MTFPLEKAKSYQFSFWTGLKILPLEEARKRAPEVLFVVRGGQSEIIAVSSTAPMMIPNFKNYLFVYRCLIHPEYRIPGLMQSLNIASIEYLESIHKTMKPSCIGVLARVENANLKKYRKVHSKSGLTFCGFAPNGDPLRVYFFKGARF